MAVREVLTKEVTVSFYFCNLIVRCIDGAVDLSVGADDIEGNPHELLSLSFRILVKETCLLMTKHLSLVHAD